jgi:electron transfer flavoprotein alpha subunit
LVVGEVVSGRLSPATAELLAAGRTLLQSLAGGLSAGLIGHELAAVAAEALEAGAERVCVVDDPLLKDSPADLCLSALAGLCQATAPEVVLFARSAWGRELAPRLAGRLGVGLLQDCLEVGIDPESGRLTALRPVYGGNFLARVRCAASPQMAVLRTQAYAPMAPDPSRRHGEVMAVPVALDASRSRMRVVRRVRHERSGVSLTEARVIISGGRGLGGPEPFRDLEELAGMLGAAVGASRAAVDAGWVPGHWQVGLTGVTVTPELYLTIGISGASQHMAGCSGAKVIVAINTDVEAPIFRAARYGVVADWQAVLPAFMEAVRSL